MSTFYLLPSRPLSGERLAGHLKALLPGLEWESSSWTDLADLLGAAAAHHADVYIVFREDLPVGEDLDRALADGFGAEPGDEIVEVQPGAPKRWRLGLAA